MTYAWASVNMEEVIYWTTLVQWWREDPSPMTGTKELLCRFHLPLLRAVKCKINVDIGRGHWSLLAYKKSNVVLSSGMPPTGRFFLFYAAFKKHFAEWTESQSCFKQKCKKWWCKKQLVTESTDQGNLTGFTAKYILSTPVHPHTHVSSRNPLELKVRKRCDQVSNLLFRLSAFRLWCCEAMLPDGPGLM